MINSFTPATTILSSQVNANNVDFATGLSNVLTRDNQAPMTAPLRLADGSAPLPGLQFANDTNTGLRRSGTDEMRWVGGGIDRMFIDAVGKMWALGALDVAGAANFQAALAAAGQVTVSNATFPPLQAERTTALTAVLQSAMRLLTTSSGDMANGFATGLGFAIRDTAAVINDIASISAARAGADNTGELLVSTSVAGVSGERARFSANGLSLAAALALPAGFIDLNEIAAPANPVADVARMYALDVGGLSRLAYRDSAGTQLVLGVSQVDRQVFTSNGTWNKPAQGTVAYVQMWGGGGGGGIQGANGGGGGGGGGAYSERWFALSALGATEAVVVGAGGAGRLIAAGNGIGAPGASSTFDNLTAYAGGAGGGGSAASGGGGGGGGGVSSVGGNGAALGGGLGGTPRPVLRSIDGLGVVVLATFGGVDVDAIGNANPFGGGAGGSSSATARAGGGGNWGGGGGGGGPDAAGPGADGGESVFGGGGGGGGGATTAGGAGGTSVFGGAGGAGGVDATPGTAGTIPSGGGGGAESANAGNGARGEVIVTVF